MELGLKGRAAVITAGSKGIGQAIARAFAVSEPRVAGMPQRNDRENG
jgi:NAD(P)-dependent dehydrogenase (short-subunit alcohol dehydrogenase family)